MALIRKLPAKAKEGARWKSQRHLKHVRSHACVNCDASAPIEAAHVRIGSDAGMGRKPSDYFAVPLCKDCHQLQHTVGERTFWEGKDVAEIIHQLVRTSPAFYEATDHRVEWERRNRG